MTATVIIFVVGLLVTVMVVGGLIYTVTGEMRKQAADSRDTNRQFEDGRTDNLESI